MAQLIRMRRKRQRSLCPFDDTIAQLKGGMQHAPKWLRSVRKFPPEKMWLTPGKVARPSEFWNDKVRGIILRNNRRPDWVPSLLNTNKSPSSTYITNHLAFQEAFDVATYGSNPDVEFAALQAWFMHKQNMSEDEAYTQARFRFRDIIKQKKRVWECYRRYIYLNKEDRNNESISIVDGWINTVQKQMKENETNQLKKQQDIINWKSNILNQQTQTTTATATASNYSNNMDNIMDNELRQDQNELNKVIKEEWEFNRKWEENIKLMRFIEYTDYIAKNPHLGLSDPTEILLGIPNDQRKKKLLTKMAFKDRRRQRLLNK